MSLMTRKEGKVFSIAVLLWVALACSKTVGGTSTGDGLGDGDGDGDGTGDGDGDGTGDGDGDGTGDGDSDGTGGAVQGDGDGDSDASGGAPGSGGAGGAQGTGGNVNPPPLEGTGFSGDVFDLGAGLVRIVYDFSDEEQIDDWVAGIPNPPNEFSIKNGTLLVDSSPTGDSGLKVVEFVRHLEVTHLEFDARLEGGDHINAYINLINDRGVWDPGTGIGLIHRMEGLQVYQFDMARNPGFEPAVPEPVPLEWSHYGLHRSGEVMEVTFDDRSASLIVGSAFTTDRALAFGSYRSVVAFDNIVIEGALHPEN